MLARSRMLENRSMSYADGLVLIPADDLFLVENVQRICICDTGICFFVMLDFNPPSMHTS